MPWKHDGKVIIEGRSWTSSEGISHPKNWSSAWSDDDKKSFGLTWEEPTVEKLYNRMFYWDDKPILDSDGNQVVTLGLKTIWTQNTKNTANSKLAETDWYVVRKAETDEAIPSKVATYRTAVRTASASIEKSITDAKDLDAFISLWDVPVDKDDKPTGNAPIDNWPEDL
jgi:hypothetical protein